MMSTNVVRKPLNRRGKKPRTNRAKIQCLVPPCVLQHEPQCFALKKQCTKKSKEDLEYARFLAKRMKGAKENARNRFPRAALTESFYF